MLVSVYIRKEDEEVWRKLPKKTQAIHDMLHGQKLSGIKIHETVPVDILKQGAGGRYNGDTPIVEVDPILVPPVAKNIDRYSNGVCKIHGTPLDGRGKCLMKGCKYA